jgi:gluconate kinase
MTQRILVMGLPGSGKTTIAEKITALLAPDCLWLNADAVREKYNDWDFSESGRIQQAVRMRELADSSNLQYVIADFVCPLEQMRDIFDPDRLIWMDTIESGRFADTNSVFVAPTGWDLRIQEFAADRWALRFVKFVLTE